jgi:hypothetical protein
MDGNFMAKHLKMQNLEDDIHPQDSASFVATDQPYKDHLAVAIEIKEVDLLSQFYQSDAKRLEETNMP